MILRFTGPSLKGWAFGRERLWLCGNGSDYSLIQGGQVNIEFLMYLERRETVNYRAAGGCCELAIMKELNMKSKNIRIRKIRRFIAIMKWGS